MKKHTIKTAMFDIGNQTASRGQKSARGQHSSKNSESLSFDYYRYVNQQTKNNTDTLQELSMHSL
jgi:hypothetical protein